MIRLIAASLVVACIPFAAMPAAAAGDNCASIADAEARLACYDGDQAASSGSSKSRWKVDQRTSPIDDSPAAFISVEATEQVVNRFGQRGYPRFIIRCLEGTTSLMFTFAGSHMTDIQDYGDVTLRVDDEKAWTTRMNESTNHQALGFWDGKSEVMNIARRLFGHETLTVRVTPFGQSSMIVQFPITGVEKAISPVRKACGW